MKKIFFVSLLLLNISVELSAACDSSSLYSISEKEHCIAIISGTAMGLAARKMLDSGSMRPSPQEANNFCQENLRQSINLGKFSSDYSGIFLQNCANEFGYSY